MKIVRPTPVMETVLASSNIAETDYPGYDNSHPYAISDRVIVVSTDVHKVYESLVNSNTGNAPASNPTKWLYIGSTNRWRMFDDSTNSQSSNADNIHVVLHATGRNDTISLLNMVGTSARIQVTDTTDGMVYNRTVNLISDGGIHDSYAYCFEPINYLPDLTLTDLPPYANTSIDILISNTGDTAKCGECILGLSKYIGKTIYGANIGIQDYSVKKVDDFGNYSILERAYNRKGNYTVEVDNTLVDFLYLMLAGYRATTILYVPTDIYTSSVTFGFYKDFNIELTYDTVSVCTLEVEGI